MTFEEILDAVIAMLHRRGRVTYRTLKRQFNLDDDAFEDLKAELLYVHPHVVDDDGRVIVALGLGLDLRVDLVTHLAAAWLPPNRAWAES